MSANCAWKFDFGKIKGKKVSKQAKTGVLALFGKKPKNHYFFTFLTIFGQKYFGSRGSLFHFAAFLLIWKWIFIDNIDFKSKSGAQIFFILKNSLKGVDLRSTHFKKSWNFLPYIAELQEQTKDQFGNWNIISNTWLTVNTALDWSFKWSPIVSLPCLILSLLALLIVRD